MMEKEQKITSNDYVIRVVDSPLQVSVDAWNALLFAQIQPTPFMRHEYLSALYTSASATPQCGWIVRFFLLEQQGALQAASVLYLKSHSRGEYVFDWAWANAYAEHGLDYYPKAVCAVPFTPVPGSRLLAQSSQLRQWLVDGMLNWCASQGMSGLHALFCSPDDVLAFQSVGLSLRHTVQFHWNNTQPGYVSFDHFLGTLTQEKRKKIRQERRKVAEADITFRVAQGAAISTSDWDFFYRCYERTYLEHGNAPYLTRDFFTRMANDMPEDWLLFVAERQGHAVASSLIATNASCVRARSRKCLEEGDGPDTAGQVAYGRYWGALESIDCLHFEACYYQPLAWCIEHGYQRFEGGAQGEHKLARALLPVTTTSAHWLAHPQFFAAVDDFLTRERAGINAYMHDLNNHSPFKRG
jgi:predicted N-acyltransferase